ncbi:MAG: hypothetical protein FWC97_00435 [Treponema sp.]|nr:hypothetical protein [Treponema sp.]
MKKFEIRVTGYTYPVSYIYSIEASNRKKAKDIAMQKFFDEKDGRKYDFHKIRTMWEHKEVNNG